VLHQLILLSITLFLAAIVPEAKADTCPANFAELESVESLGRRYADLDDRIQNAFGGNLYRLQKNSSPEFANEWNRGLIQGLREIPMVVRNPKRIIGLNDEQLAGLFWRVKNHPLSAPNTTLTKKYDRQKRGLGFCFGRAMVAHREALKMGVAKESIRKIWAVGPMKTADGYWQHHVATMVRNLKGEWYVLDPLDRRAMPVADWLESVRHSFPSPNLQLFSTNPARFSPEDARSILPGTTKSKYFNGYFQDMLEQSRAEVKAVLDQRRGIDSCPAEKSSLWGCMKETLGIFR
jgi:hypothetical protein